MEHDLRMRVARLEARVRDLESLMGVASEEAPPPARPAVAVAEPAFAVAAEEAAPESRMAAIGRAEAPPVAPPVAPPISNRPIIAPPVRRDRPEAPAESAPFDLERFIGMRGFMALGAIVLVVGLSLLLKLAYDSGWIGRVAPGFRCAGVAGFGAFLLVAGEVIRRRLGAFASVGASAAGLGALYGAAYAAHGMYHLVPASVTFALLALVAGLGLVIAGRANQAALAVLALIGAYLNPLIMHEASGAAAVLPVYLLLLLGVGLVLSAWRAAPFRALRPLVWWGTVLLGSLWMVRDGTDVPVLALAFLAAVWGGVHAELAISARVPSARGDREPGLDAEDAPALPVQWSGARFIATSFSTSSWCAFFGLVVIRAGGGALGLSDWMAPGAVGAVALTLALVLSGNLRMLRDVPRTDLERLGAGLTAQAGAMLIAAIALAVSGWYQSVAWLAVGAAGVFAGRWVRARGLDVYGLVVLSIAVARLLILDAPFVAPASWAHEAGGLVFSRWSVLMLAGAAAWWIAAGLMMAERGRSRFGAFLGQSAGVVGTSLLALLLLDPDADGLSVSAAWLGLALVAAAVGRRIGSIPQVVLSFLLLGVATARIAAGAPLVGRPETTYFTVAGLAVTRWMVLMFSAAGAWIGAAALIPPDRSRPRDDTLPGLPALPVGIGVVLLYAGFLRADVAVAPLTLAWGGIAGVLIAAHSRRPRLALDLLGLAGLGAATIAWAWGYPRAWMSSTAPSLLHAGLILAAYLAAIGIGGALWLRSARNPAKPTSPELVPAVMPAAGLLLLIATSLEVARVAGIVTADLTVRRAAVSIWWGLVGVALVAAGFVRGYPRVRYAGLALLGAGTAKAVILDLAEVGAAWRIVSFVGLGLLMLGVAVAYSSITRVRARRAAGET